MAVPDWPNTFGYNMFFFPISQWVGGVFYEHTHRLLASGVGLMTTVLALWLHGTGARRFLQWTGVVLGVLAVVAKVLAPARGADALVLLVVGMTAFASGFFWPRCAPAAAWLRRLGVIAFVAVVLQGVLGGLRVVLFKDEIGIFHATLAQLFFVLVCSLALFTSEWWEKQFGLAAAGTGISRATERGVAQGNVWLFWVCAGAGALILFQLILGATMRHQHAGLAIPDFPTAYGKLWPATDVQSVSRYNQQRIEVLAANPITAFQIILQMLHRILAIVIFAGVAFCAWSVRRQLGARHLAASLGLVWLGLILVQVGLGAATILSNKAADIATAHVLVGALSLACAGLLSIVLFALLGIRRERVRVDRRVETPSCFSARPSPAVGME